MSAVSPAHAQSSDSLEIVGTWSLDLNRSNFEPGSGPQKVTRQFFIDDDGFLVSVRITEGGGGNPSFSMARVKLDGRDYPVWTNGTVYGFLAENTPTMGTASFERIDDRPMRLTQKNADGEVTSTSPSDWEVSSAGGTLTYTTTGTNADGVRVHSAEVYSRVEN